MIAQVTKPHSTFCESDNCHASSIHKVRTNGYMSQVESSITASLERYAYLPDNNFTICLLHDLLAALCSDEKRLERTTESSDRDIRNLLGVMQVITNIIESLNSLNTKKAEPFTSTEPLYLPSLKNLLALLQTILNEALNTEEKYGDDILYTCCA